MLVDLVCAASKVGAVVLATVFGLPIPFSALCHVMAQLIGGLHVMSCVVWASVLTQDPPLA